MVCEPCVCKVVLKFSIYRLFWLNSFHSQTAGVCQQDAIISVQICATDQELAEARWSPLSKAGYSLSNHRLQRSSATVANDHHWRPSHASFNIHRVSVADDAVSAISLNIHITSRGTVAKITIKKCFYVIDRDQKSFYKMKARTVAVISVACILIINEQKKITMVG